MSSRGTGRAKLNEARRCTRSTSVLVLRAELIAKDFGLANEPAFLTFMTMLVSSRATVTAHMVGCASRSTVTEPFEKFTCQLRNFLLKKKKKKNSHWPIEKSKNRQPWRGRFLREHATGELSRGWQKTSELHWPGPAPDAPSLTQTLIIQSVYCDRQKRFSQNERRRADVPSLASDFLILSRDLVMIL